MALKRETATTFKGTGRNRGRTCVKVKTDTKGKVLFRRHGRAFKDSGVRFYGCFSSPSKAKTRVDSLKSGRSGKRKLSKRRKK